MNFSALLEQIGQNKSRAAFRKLFQYYAPRVKSVLLRGNLPEPDAEELAQETMLTVWQKAAQFNPAKSSASTWIYAIARNKRIDRLRKKQAMTIPLEEEMLEKNIVAANSINEWTAGNIKDKLASAMAALPKEQSSLLRKSFYEDMSHAQIAADTHIPLGTIKSRLRQGVAHLRKMLFKNGNDN